MPRRESNSFSAKAKLSIDWESSPALERLSAGKAGLDIVPPLKLISFIGFPAKQDDAPFTHRRKINQAAGVILQLHTQTLEFADAE